MRPRPATSEFPLPRPLPARLRSAAARRWRRLWRRTLVGRQGEAAERAMDYLAAWSPQPLSNDDGDAPQISALAAAAAVAARFGQARLAQCNAQHLLSRQRPDGGFGGGDGAASLEATGQALRALLALEDGAHAASDVDIPSAAGGAAEFLSTHVDGGGEIILPAGSLGAAARWEPALHLVWLAPLAAAGSRWQQAAHRDAARRGLRALQRRIDLARWQAPTNRLAEWVNALLDLGDVELARAALRLPSALQRRDGSVPVLPRARWVCAAGLAGLATAWFRLGSPADRQRGDAALAWLARRQTASGALTTGWGPGASKVGGQDVTAVARFLEAARWQVRSAFAAAGQTGCEFPAEIDARDGRLASVLQWSATLAEGSAVADVGCGSGRYLKHLARPPHDFHLTGVDPDHNALAQLPPKIHGRRGELLNIPATDGEFDAVLCVEALEHALLPAAAVDELCRTVRPGGSILVIDKHRGYQPLSDHQPWERWFTPEEVSAWLARHCDEVTVRPMAHGPHRRPTGLFLCWMARRHMAARRAA